MPKKIFECAPDFAPSATANYCGSGPFVIQHEFDHEPTFLIDKRSGRTVAEFPPELSVEMRKYLAHQVALKLCTTSRTAHEAEYVALADSHGRDGELEIDTDAIVSMGDDISGAYVAAWVWVDEPRLRSEYADHELYMVLLDHDKPVVGRKIDVDREQLSTVIEALRESVTRYKKMYDPSKLLPRLLFKEELDANFDRTWGRAEHQTRPPRKKRRRRK